MRNACAFAERERSFIRRPFPALNSLQDTLHVCGICDGNFAFGQDTTSFWNVHNVRGFRDTDFCNAPLFRNAIRQRLSFL